MCVCPCRREKGESQQVETRKLLLLPSSRALTVQRDASGYGLTLSGDKPVFVQTVRPGGAASRAGVRPDDVILRVNGRKVTHESHTDVVNLIQGKRKRGPSLLKPPFYDSPTHLGLPWPKKGGRNLKLSFSLPTAQDSVSLTVVQPQREDLNANPAINEEDEEDAMSNRSGNSSRVTAPIPATVSVPPPHSLCMCSPIKARWLSFHY